MCYIQHSYHWLFASRYIKMYNNVGTTWKENLNKILPSCHFGNGTWCRMGGNLVICFCFWSSSCFCSKRPCQVHRLYELVVIRKQNSWCDHRKSKSEEETLLRSHSIVATPVNWISDLLSRKEMKRIIAT